jgi:hypothetical protein
MKIDVGEGQIEFLDPGATFYFYGVKATASFSWGVKRKHA